MSDGVWDLESDVVVVGGGAAGMAAALTAAHDGASVLLLERASETGGTTAKSGGGIWILNNSLMRADDGVRRAHSITTWFHHALFMLPSCAPSSIPMRTKSAVLVSAAQPPNTFRTNLEATVTRWNEMAARGVDEDHHRGETPIQVEWSQTTRGQGAAQDRRLRLNGARHALQLR